MLCTKQAIQKPGALSVYMNGRKRGMNRVLQVINGFVAFGCEFGLLPLFLNKI